MDPAAVTALVLVQPALLTITGVSVSAILLATLLGARTPRGLLAAIRSLARRPSGATAAPALVVPGEPARGSAVA